MAEIKRGEWVAELHGDDMDLELARNLFGESKDFAVVQIEGAAGKAITVLSSKQFDELPERDMRMTSPQICRMVNGLLFILDRKRQPLRIGGMRQRSANDGWNIHMVVEPGYLELRGAFLTATITQSGMASATPTRQSGWADLAGRDDAVEEVLMFLRNDNPEWFDLYKAFERMRDDINRRLGQHREDEMGWPAKSELDHFSRSAQVLGTRKLKVGWLSTVRHNANDRSP